jgi:hypothetical protein
MTKLTITQELPVDLIGLLEGVGLDDAIEKLKDIPYEYPEYSDFFFDANYEYEYTSLVLKAKRLETDKEHEKRIAKEKKEREARKITLEKRKAQLIKDAKKLGLKVVE